MEYYSALKRKEILPYATDEEPGGHYAKWNKPVMKRQILSDSTYMRYLAQLNSYKQKVEQWLPGAGAGGRSCCLMAMELQFYRRKRVLEIGAQQPEYTLHYWTVYLKMVKMVFYVICILIQFLKEGGKQGMK